MATLVLTTVGGILGGPIGAAVGAVLGNQVDRAVLAPTKARVGPRLTDLAVQTSRYGEQLPRVFGTMRVAGCVIWSTDLLETRSKSRGGKGQPSTTTYSYAASFAVALSGRRAAGVGRVWADGKLLRGAAGDWKSQVGAFRFHAGDEAQAPDPLMASAVAHAPAHRGTAYAVFEQLQLADFGNRIPSLTFELIAEAAPVALGAIAGELGRDAGLTSGLAQEVGGFAASGSSVAAAVAVLAQIGGVEAAPRDGRLVLDVLAEPAVPLDADLDTTWTRRPIDTVPRTLTVSHYDRARDYQVGVQAARRPGAGWRDEAVDMPAVLEAGAARALAEAVLLRAEGKAEGARVTAAIDAIGIAPGRAVTLPGDPRRWRVARSSLEHGAVTLELVPVTASPGTPVVADAGAPPPVQDVPVGETLVEAFELPPLTDTLPRVPQLLVAAAGTQPGWRSAALAVSMDAGASWTPSGMTVAPATIGRLLAPLARAEEWLEDRANVFEVELAHDAMPLLPADAALRDRGANLALVGDELLQFGDAVQVAPRRWRLATLWRARRGTAAAAHAAGARFVLIEEDALAVLPLGGAAPGDHVAVLASGTGDAGATAEVTLTGASVAPPAPVHLTALTAGDGTTVRWQRRSRQGWRWTDGGDVPLIEECEAYRVRVSSPVGTRIVLVDTPLAEITAAERTAGAVTVEVCQLGTFAASPVASITI